MKGYFFGMIIAIAVVTLTMEGKWNLYLQYHSLLIVFGGTLAIFFLASPSTVIRDLFRKTLKLLYKKDERFEDSKDILMNLAKNKFSKVETDNILINYAQELWEQGVEHGLFIGLISQKRDELETEVLASIQNLKNLAKYPPTLGMIGTVMGMIAMFSQMQNSRDNIGGHLAVAMTATFFGLILTNMLISPLADRLMVRHLQRKKVYNNIYQILLLINNDEAVSIINAELEERLA